MSLLMRLMDEDGFENKRVLLLEEDLSVRNDRTWCFWEQESGYFEELVYKRWQNLSFVADDRSVPLDLGPYQYKMIRSLDFFEHCLNRIKRHPNIKCWQEKIYKLDRAGDIWTFGLSDRMVAVQAAFVFSSVSLFPQTKPDLELLQHFKGWVVETPTPEFDPEKAVLMDFSVDQRHLPAVFVYVLPLSPYRALVEYTVFSESVFANEDYDQALSDYLNNKLQLQHYTITHTEWGCIPMTSRRFPQYKDGIYYIGAVGGQTKASSGYTFQFIQKQVNEIVSDIKHESLSRTEWKKRSRFDYYDAILLQVLCQRQMKGSEIFKRLFTTLPAGLIFRFLDNETSFRNEISVMNSMPWRTFVPAAIQQLRRKGR